MMGFCHSRVMGTIPFAPGSLQFEKFHMEQPHMFLIGGFQSLLKLPLYSDRVLMLW